MLVDLFKVIAPYILHPLLLVEIFLPHLRLVSWWTGRKAFDPVRDVAALSHKVILVTGGNAGLGAETIYQLARHDPRKIYLASRSERRGKAAVKHLQDRLLSEARIAASAFPEIEAIVLDLANLDSVRQAASYVSSKEQRLDILILNAGIMGSPPARISSGHEIHLGTNHVGHFLLTRLLLPLMERTAQSVEGADVRVVTVSSEAFNIAPRRPRDCVDLITGAPDLLHRSGPYMRYGVSKAANILFAAELARRYGRKGIMSVSLHPGMILTDLYSTTLNDNALAGFGLPTTAGLLFDDVRHGALNQIWCAAGAKKFDLENGGYYTPVGCLRSNAFAADTPSAKKLWAWTDDELEKLGMYEVNNGFAVQRPVKISPTEWYR